METVIKLTDKVTEKLSYLKKLSGDDDSIIDQETKKEIAAAVSTIEQEIGNANDNNGKSNPISLKKTEENTKDNKKECEVLRIGSIGKSSTRTPIKESNEIYKSLVGGAADWKEPEIQVKNLKRLTSDSFVLSNESDKKEYVRYYMCFKDYLHSATAKPAFCNLISIIAYNILNTLNEECFDEMLNGRLELKNVLAYSGLFLYKSSDDSNVCSIYEPDGFLTIMIPKNLEDELIINNPRKVSYSIADWLYPTLNGVIMNFNDMKKLLLDSKCIAYKSTCNEKGMHDAHTLLHRDTTNNNLIYQDINISDDVVLGQYRL